MFFCRFFFFFFFLGGGGGGVADYALWTLGSVFLIFKRATKFYIPMLQTSTLAILLMFSCFSISAIHEVLGITFKGCRSRDP